MPRPPPPPPPAHAHAHAHAHTPLYCGYRGLQDRGGEDGKAAGSHLIVSLCKAQRPDEALDVYRSMLAYKLPSDTAARRLRAPPLRLEASLAPPLPLSTSSQPFLGVRAESLSIQPSSRAEAISSMPQLPLAGTLHEAAPDSSPVIEVSAVEAASGGLHDSHARPAVPGSRNEQQVQAPHLHATAAVKLQSMAAYPEPAGELEQLSSMLWPVKGSRQLPHDLDPGEQPELQAAPTRSPTAASAADTLPNRLSAGGPQAFKAQSPSTAEGTPADAVSTCESQAEETPRRNGAGSLPVDSTAVEAAAAPPSASLLADSKDRSAQAAGGPVQRHLGPRVPDLRRLEAGPAAVPLIPQPAAIAALVTAMACKGRLEEALQLLRQLQQDPAGLAATTLSARTMWQSLIECACRRWRIDTALEVGLLIYLGTQTPTNHPSSICLNFPGQRFLSKDAAEGQTGS